MKRFGSCLTLLLLIFVFSVSHANADLVVGTISDFQDGTVQGWTQAFNINVTNVPDAGPLGTGDNALELANGGSGNFAMYNETVGGVISPAVGSITVDILRPFGESDAEIRLVLFEDPGIGGDRWTSTNATLISGDGLWNTYSFSILESDLTRVAGGGTYADLVNNFNRIMFRYDPGPPSGGGLDLDGTMQFDNIIARPAVPEPASMAIGVFLIGALVMRRRR